MENRDVRFASEEKWESQIMEQMKFSVSTADPFDIRTIWKGSLHVDGPCQSLDPNLLSMNNFSKFIVSHTNLFQEKKKIFNFICS